MLNKQQRTIARLALAVGELQEQVKELKKEKKTRASKFSPPSLEQVKAYCLERRNSVDAELFHDHYTSQGWYVGKVTMKDWKAAVRTWEKSSFNHPPASEAAVVAANEGIEKRRRERAKRQAQYAAEDAQAIRPKLRRLP